MPASFMFFINIIGTITFALSGAIIAIRKGMDIFGVNIIAIVTTVGGGVLRDVLIGHVPPEMFRNPSYTGIAVITANMAFLYLYLKKKEVSKNVVFVYEKLLFLFDTLGLASFTINGVNAGMETSKEVNFFLVIFLGVVTGVGGGLVRDIMANRRPYIFVKHIYASAALAGAVATTMLWESIEKNLAMSIGFFIIITIRVLAAYFKWNLPRIYDKDMEER